MDIFDDWRFKRYTPSLWLCLRNESFKDIDVMKMRALQKVILAKPLEKIAKLEYYKSLMKEITERELKITEYNRQMSKMRQIEIPKIDEAEVVNVSKVIIEGLIIVWRKIFCTSETHFTRLYRFGGFYKSTKFLYMQRDENVARMLNFYRIMVKAEYTHQCQYHGVEMNIPWALVGEREYEMYFHSGREIGHEEACNMIVCDLLTLAQAFGG